MTQTKIFEGLTHEEMQGLVNSVVSIDQYKPKIGENADTVVVAFTVQYEADISNRTNPLQSMQFNILLLPKAQYLLRVTSQTLREINARYTPPGLHNP